MAEWCPATKVITRTRVTMPPGDPRFALAGRVEEEATFCETNREFIHRCHRAAGHGDFHICGCGWSWGRPAPRG